MPDTYTDSIIAEQNVAVTTADGWLVCLAKRSRLGGAWMYDAQYFDDWHETQARYEDPPGQWQATAIWACKDGEPLCKLSAYRIGQLRKE